MTINPNQVLNLMIRRNPQIQNNPQIAEMMKVIQSGDTSRGSQLADNICKTYGLTREQAFSQAQNWAQQMMYRR